MSPIRTLVVDDSALVRKLVTESLSRDPEIEVVGTAMDPYVARDKILALDPDVLTLDIEMPRMDGITFLKLIMRHRPMPVVVMSSLTAAGSGKALEALQAGAVEVIAKPGSAFSVGDAAEMIAKVKAAAHSRFRRRREAGGGPSTAESTGLGPPPAPRPTLVKPPPAGASSLVRTGAGGRPARRYGVRDLILLGASTGGTEALKTVITHLSADLPGICVVQHIPAYFSAAFAERLHQLSALEVREARDRDEVRSGLVLVAPGGHHLVLRWGGTRYVVELSQGPPVHHQRPAVDVMFDSVVKAGGARDALALLLTGMGSDGATGMLRLREGGATTIAQDERSCVVFGMPREAIRLGAAQEVLALDRMAERIERHASSIAQR